MIESKQNQQVKNWKKLHKKKYRDQEKKFLIEGWHLVEEALNSDWKVEALIVNEQSEVPDEWDQSNTYYVSDSVFQDLTQTDTPQGVMAVVQQKSWGLEQSFKRLLLVDAVQDPGNVGTIIRSALAFHVDAVILGKGTVDLYNDKVIRASQGAIFHLPIIREDLNDWIQKCQSDGIPVFATALDEQATPLKHIEYQEAYAIVVGNEGSGISTEILEQADQTVYIPIAKNSESLNVGVATSIVLYHFEQLT